MAAVIPAPADIQSTRQQQALDVGWCRNHVCGVQRVTVAIAAATVSIFE